MQGNTAGTEKSIRQIQNMKYNQSAIGSSLSLQSGLTSKEYFYLTYVLSLSGWSMKPISDVDKWCQRKQELKNTMIILISTIDSQHLEVKRIRSLTLHKLIVSLLLLVL